MVRNLRTRSRFRQHGAVQDDLVKMTSAEYVEQQVINNHGCYVTNSGNKSLLVFINVLGVKGVCSCSE